MTKISFGSIRNKDTMTIFVFKDFNGIMLSGFYETPPQSGNESMGPAIDMCDMDPRVK